MGGWILLREEEEEQYLWGNYLFIAMPNFQVHDISPLKQ